MEKAAFPRFINPAYFSFIIFLLVNSIFYYSNVNRSDFSMPHISFKCTLFPLDLRSLAIIESAAVPCIIYHKAKFTVRLTTFFHKKYMSRYIILNFWNR